ncbi:hypothetical protein SRHO_G00189010 [Serrasalmus rhombeus]
MEEVFQMGSKGGLQCQPVAVRSPTPVQVVAVKACDGFLESGVKTVSTFLHSSKFLLRDSHQKMMPREASQMPEIGRNCAREYGA